MSSAAVRIVDSENRTIPALVRDCLIVGLVVFAASLLGIMTRPVGFLAAFWPANALLLGLFVRFPRLASFWAWPTAAIAYLAADFVTGGEVLQTYWLTGANLAGVATGFAATRFLSVGDRALQRPGSIFYIFGVCMIAAGASALAGGGAAKLVFARDFMTGAAFWFATEFVNMAIILPLIIAFPGMAELRRQVSFKNWLSLVPFLCTCLAMVAAHFVGGPGYISFSVPALLWCALSYSLFVTALITLLVCSWQMVAISADWVSFPMGEDVLVSTISLRLGIVFLALGPLTVATISTARNRLLASLHRLANFDFLTEALSRAAFMTRASELVERKTSASRGPALLMLDLDRFKLINDRYGHAVGDRALSSFAAIVRGSIGGDDLFGRIGGEEFAIVLRDVTRKGALAIAEEIRARTASQPIDLGEGDSIPVTVSIGVVFGGSNLGYMLRDADEALYRAKEDGRNRVMDAGSASTRDRRRGGSRQTAA